MLVGPYIFSLSKPLRFARGLAAAMPLREADDMPIGGEQRSTAPMLEKRKVVLSNRDAL